MIHVNLRINFVEIKGFPQFQVYVLGLESKPKITFNVISLLYLTYGFYSVEDLYSSYHLIKVYSFIIRF